MATELVIRPTRFIKTGTEIEARFIGDEDTPMWYKGTVKKLNHFGEDVLGTYVNCDVLYEDGEDVPDSVFYDKDFNDEKNDDSWRFEGNISTLITYMLLNNEEIINLKAQLADRNEKIKEIVKQVIDEEIEDDSDSNEEIEVYTEESPSSQKPSLFWNILKYSTLVSLFGFSVMMVATDYV